MAAPVEAPKPMRQQVQELLQPLLPSTWRWVRDERSLDTQQSIVVRLSQQSVTRHPSAPQSALLVNFTIRIVSPAADPGVAEDGLDDALDLMLIALNGFKGKTLDWSKAEKVLAPIAPEVNRLAYDLTVTAVTNTPTPKE